MGKSVKIGQPLAFDGKERYRVRFKSSDCLNCDKRLNCTKSKKWRVVSFAGREEQEFLEKTRLTEQSPEWRNLYQERAGIEGKMRAIGQRIRFKTNQIYWKSKDASAQYSRRLSGKYCQRSSLAGGQTAGKNKSFEVCRTSRNESLRIRQQYPFVGTYPILSFEELKFIIKISFSLRHRS